MIISDINSIIEALKADRVNKIYYNPEKASARIKEVISLCKKRGVPVKKSVIKGEHPIKAEVSPVPYASLDHIIERALLKSSPIVILDGVKDPNNLGAVIRTAEFFSCAGVVIRKRRSAGINETVAKVSTGAVFHIPIARENPVNAVKKIKNAGIEVYSAENFGEDISQFDLTPPIAFVIGEEDKGVSKPVLKVCDGVLKIRGFGKVNSLNLSNATSILIYESLRQGGKFG
ncbi:rRNA methylase, putative, group 3 [Archaeoglobus sulfaticallidus PM70-1]|uniref:rRNA methylase, putative, group 3 n=1 Tax=Archaeoglobus sulfaticallidus PM70-1 TaxID=387631 RepID=N0BFR9_9EURY|nr:23S rRNA (guanosine(2251)-2'-O)-methyltransferase RlmB [Archaeoglobus sulfaticallidus]AGK61873.1 rRNA methylase, putative, group 3 [Archaeoglobus sulfaticallidus PM70-1]